MISADFPFTKKFVEIHGKQLAYVEEGSGDPSGDPIVLLHGNPTSSYLWRNVIPHLSDLGRVIVPDLIGQGDSDTIAPTEGAERYSFHVAYDYLSAQLQQLGCDTNVTLVIHDWGSGLGFNWAKHNPEKVKGIAYMEGITTPLEWSDWPEAASIFQAFRSDKGGELILDRNLFIEGVLPSAILRDLSDAEMDHYRAPFRDRDSRQVTLNWPRSIPLAGEPQDVVALVKAYGEFMKASPIPKLFINAEPGSILVGRQRDFCRTWPNQTEVTVKGAHFIQEDSPDDIGQAVASWLQAL